MNAQPDLFGGETPLELGPRQQLVYAALVEAAHPLTADEIGAIVHANRGTHAADDRCRYCAREGNDVLHSLRRKGLVRSDRHGNWRTAQEPPSDGYDPATAPIPF